MTSTVRSTYLCGAEYKARLNLPQDPDHRHNVVIEQWRVFDLMHAHDHPECTTESDDLDGRSSP